MARGAIKKQSAKGGKKMSSKAKPAISSPLKKAATPIVLAEPRTGSKWVAETFARECDKDIYLGLLWFKGPRIPLAVYPNHKNTSSEEVLRILREGRAVGHGHWNSLPRFSAEVSEEIKRCEIVTVERDSWDQFLSLCALVYRAVGSIDASVAARHFARMKAVSRIIKAKYTPVKTLVYEEIADPAYRLKSRNGKLTLLENDMESIVREFANVGG